VQWNNSAWEVCETWDEENTVRRRKGERGRSRANVESCTQKVQRTTGIEASSCKGWTLSETVEIRIAGVRETEEADRRYKAHDKTGQIVPARLGRIHKEL